MPRYADFAKWLEETRSYAGWSFSGTEIDQICELVRWWATGPSRDRAVDGRRFTYDVKDYAARVGLMIWRCNRHGRKGEGTWDACPECARRGRGRSGGFRLVAPDDLGRFSPQHFLPAEALWRLVRDDVLEGAESKGWSAACSKGWINLNLYPEGHRFAERRDYEAKLDILHRLDVAGYLHFQWAGSIWDIRVL